MGRRWAVVLGSVAAIVGLTVGTVRLLAYVRPLPEAADATFAGGELDYAGTSVASAGDVNGDGLDDLLIGADLGLAVNGRQAGRAYLVLGRAAPDWGQGFDLGRADAMFVGEGHLDHAGIAVAGAGDVNGDGLDDMLIGAWLNRPTAALTNAGKAYLVLGRRAADWGRKFELAQADASFAGAAIGEYAGCAVAGAGDVNGDGLGDLLVGSYLGRGMQGSAGKAYLVLGRRAADWGRGMPLDQADAVFMGERSSDFAGLSLGAAGDVDGDGLGDFLVGAYGNDATGSEAGKAYLVRGRRAADWGRAFNLGKADVVFTSTAVGLRAGRTVAGVGDVNRDGLADLVVGAPGGPEAADDGGRAYLVLGRPASAWTTPFSLGGADSTLHGAGITETLGAGAAGAGDVNRDGYADFLVSATDPEPADGHHAAGRCYLVLGRPQAWPRDMAMSDVATAVDRVAFDGTVAGEAACLGLGGGGDVNGDGFADMAIGAPRNAEAARSAGRVYLVLGKGLVFQKRAPRSPALRGETITFTLRYTYTGAQPMSEVRIVDFPPRELEFVRCAGGVSCGRDGLLVAWNVGLIGPLGTGTVALALRVPTGLALGTTITNTALITTPFLMAPLRSAAVVRVGVRSPTPARTATATATATRRAATRTATATRTPPGSPTATATPTITETPTATDTTAPTHAPPGRYAVHLPWARR